MAMHKAGDLVWAKMKGYTAWPAVVLSNTDVPLACPTGKHPVLFFGTNETGFLKPIELFAYMAFRNKFEKPQKTKGFNLALLEIRKEAGIPDDDEIPPPPLPNTPKQKTPKATPKATPKVVPKVQKSTPKLIAKPAIAVKIKARTSLKKETVSEILEPSVNLFSSFAVNNSYDLDSVISKNHDSRGSKCPIAKKRVAMSGDKFNKPQMVNEPQHAKKSPLKSPIKSRICSPDDEFCAPKKAKKDDTLGDQFSTVEDTKVVELTSNQSNKDKQKFDEIVVQMRDLVSFFLTPSNFTATEVAKMSANDIINIDIKSFCDVHENNKKSIVNPFEKAAQQSTIELLKLRRSCYSMLNLIDPKFTTENLENESDRVDICMNKCVTHLRRENHENVEEPEEN